MATKLLDPTYYSGLWVLPHAAGALGLAAVNRVGVCRSSPHACCPRGDSLPVPVRGTIGAVAAEDRDVS
jgi:hypothetical protein